MDAILKGHEGARRLLASDPWLGLHWDEGAEVGGPHGPYYQSQKLARYQAAVRALVEKGLAYWDYATVDELRAERQAADRGSSSCRSIGI